MGGEGGTTIIGGIGGVTMGIEGIGGTGGALTEINVLVSFAGPSGLKNSSSPASPKSINNF